MTRSRTTEVARIFVRMLVVSNRVENLDFNRGMWFVIDIFKKFHQSLDEKSQSTLNSEILDVLRILFHRYGADLDFESDIEVLRFFAHFIESFKKPDEPIIAGQI
mgnify:CR=1 FL=1